MGKGIVMTGTGVYVGNSVNVAIAVGPVVGVHVAGNVSGTGVDGCGVITAGPQEARRIKKPKKRYFRIYDLRFLLNVDSIQFSISCLDASRSG